ncbi:MAG TPA: FHA domain-containing protein [Pyrinomonadaceae bacterium]|nr:FHA domain-containing protein [Pyrinomonadaceae bacterium]
MREIILTYPTPEGSREISVTNGKISFGRGSEADFRFEDNGLSRLNSTIYRENDRVWVVDENSTNGTFVNGVKVSGSGTPLNSGDTIKLGNSTNLKVKIVEKQAQKSAVSANQSKTKTVSASSNNPSSIIPIAIIAVAFFVVSISAVVVGIKVFGGNKPEISQNNDNEDVTEINTEKEEKSPTPTPKTEKTKETNSIVSENTNLTNSPEASNTGNISNLPSGKKYFEMSDGEKRQYIEAKAMRVAQVIGNNSSEKIPSAAVDKIKSFVDAYASRVKVKPLSGCRFGDNLQATFERASKNAPFINRAFNAKGIDPRIGLYLAMIESEHCVCLQSPTGPLGMFQFTFATAKLHYEPSSGVVKGASPSNPDDRCLPEPSARAAASYMKALTGRYGTGPSSVPLAIGSYNSGEGGLSTNLEKALESGSGLERDFWTLIAKGEILSKQFQSENFKYVPKFFAAAIIGENPQDFGLTLQPISTYTK